MAARILIVEDDPDIAELVGRYLEKAGYSIAKVSNGRDALDAVRAKPPDLVILDLMLPQIDGLEVCRLLRANDKTAGIPIIMLTARAEESERIVGLERDLAAGSFACLNGNAFSLADAFWGVNLVRLNYLGLGSMWDALPHVARYADVLARRPSLCKEAIQASLDSMPHSRYMDAMADCRSEVPA